MHSSRMRAARLLPVSPSMHCPRVVSAPGGGVPASGPRVPASAPGGVPTSGMGVPASCPEGDMCVFQDAMGQTPPPCGQNDRYV